MTENIDMYWWSGAQNKNFGDVLGPALVHKFTGKTPNLVSAEESSLVTIGSILEHLPPKYSGAVAGIGVAHSQTRNLLEGAEVLALRGQLAVAATGAKEVKLLADPGLLAIDMVEDYPEKEYEFGVIKHYADKNTKTPHGALEINILDPIEKVIFDAAKCEKIISSSLHGIILADALGLPRMWAKHSRVQGGGHKFHDYASSFGQSIEPGLWMSAPKKQVREKQEALRNIFSCL